MTKLIKLFAVNYLTLCLLFIHSCKTVEKNTMNTSETENTIRLKLMNETNIKINKPITVTLYGYDKFMADVGATIISEKKIGITQFPINVSLEVPLKPELLIVPKISAKENAKYYLSVYCDNNNNGKDDKGDLKINFDNGFPYVNLNNEEVQVFYVKEL